MSFRNPTASYLDRLAFLIEQAEVARIEQKNARRRLRNRLRRILAKRWNRPATKVPG